MNARSATAYTHYDALKVARDAPVEVIRAAYRSLSQKYHPDRNSGVTDSDQVMATLNLAYDVLSHPAKRLEYDSAMAERERPIASKAVAKSTQLMVRAGNRVTFTVKVWRRPLYVTTATLAILGALAAYSATERRDSWLEEAWQESWRSNRGLASAPERHSVPGALGAAEQLTRTDGSAPTGLRWETSIEQGKGPSPIAPRPF